jgi:hypothetical protein
MNCRIVFCLVFTNAKKVLMWYHNSKSILWDCKLFFTWIHIPINCSGSERASTSSLLWVSLCGGMMSVGWRWKRTTTAGGALIVWYSDWGEGEMETWLSDSESDQCWDDLFIAVKCGSQVVWGGCPTTLVWI